MSGYVFTSSARDDLADIWLYTEQAWGEQQADRYIEGLFVCCARIAAGILPGKPVPGFDGVRSRRCEHHVLFFMERGDETVIIALFHQRMDLIRRLEQRL